MAAKSPINPRTRAGLAQSVGAVEFKVWCDINGYIVGIESNNGDPIEGKGVGLSIQIDANGSMISEIVIETPGLATAACRWKKVNGVWVCG